MAAVAQRIVCGVVLFLVNLVEGIDNVYDVEVSYIERFPSEFDASFGQSLSPLGIRVLSQRVPFRELPCWLLLPFRLRLCVQPPWLRVRPFWPPERRRDRPQLLPDVSQARSVAQ